MVTLSSLLTVRVGILLKSIVFSSVKSAKRICKKAFLNLIMGKFEVSSVTRFSEILPFMQNSASI